VARAESFVPKPRNRSLKAVVLTLGAVSLLAIEMGIAPLAYGLVALAVILTLLSRSVVIAGPNEALVLSGVVHRRRDGTQVGYRVVHAGRALRRPVVEAASRLDLGLFVVDVVVPDARLRSGERAELCLGACAKVDSEPSKLARAVERFLGREPSELADAVRGAAVTAARQVLATTRLAEAVERPDGVAAAIREEAERELERVGLTLWALELYSVEEDAG
jgi:uncharacterized membrane protein YqiK